MVSLELINEVKAKKKGEHYLPVFQVVAQVESDEPENTVVQEMQAGYMLNEHLLRPAMITISKGE